MARRKLTKRQQQRIASIQEARRARYESRAKRTQVAGSPDQARPGIIVTRHGQNLVVRDEHGQFQHCLFRQNLGELVCGDEVVWQPTEPGEGVVTALLNRRSVLSRPDYVGRDKPLAANLSQIVVVIAPQPEPTGYLVDQYLVAAELIGVPALLALNKADLLDAAELAMFRERFAHYRTAGYRLITVSAKVEHGLDALAEVLAGQTSILGGQSGVGKSSLVRSLIPDQKVQVGRLSQATGLGRHTTSAATLYQLPMGGQLIDSPGVRSFRLGPLSRPELERCYPEFRPHLGRCRFSNCAHQSEPDCALQAALGAGSIHPDRMASFQHLAENLPKNQESAPR
jgi:ribosome biogenesis GTPase